MTQVNLILNLMVGHHRMLEALLLILKENIDKKSENMMDFFDNFEWELQKHLFTEEKVIFKLCREDFPEICKMVEKVEQEHTVMMEMLEDMRIDLINKSKTDIDGFQDFVARHRSFEESKLYPILDQRLSEEAKKEMVDKIREIPIKR